MELTNKEREKLGFFITDMLTERGLKIKEEWADDVSKEHDFESFVLEFEKYLTVIENYEDE